MYRELASTRTSVETPSAGLSPENSILDIETTGRGRDGPFSKSEHIHTEFMEVGRTNGGKDF